MSTRRPIRSELARRRETRFLSYLAIEGPPGCGKTALVSMLGRELGGMLILDRAGENPFLGDFYRDPRRYAFKTQLFFTLSRYMQQEEIIQRDLFHPLVITDYLFVRDRLYASLTLDDRELALYEKLIGLMEPDVPRPDLVIYMQHDAESLHKRISGAGDGWRKRVSREYLVAVVEAYNYYFLHFEEAPLLILGGGDIDLSADGRMLDDLIEELEKPHSGIRYFNPAG